MCKFRTFFYDKRVWFIAKVGQYVLKVNVSAVKVWWTDSSGYLRLASRLVCQSLLFWTSKQKAQLQKTNQAEHLVWVFRIRVCLQAGEANRAFAHGTWLQARRLVRCFAWNATLRWFKFWRCFRDKDERCASHDQSEDGGSKCGNRWIRLLFVIWRHFYFTKQSIKGLFCLYIF